MTIGIDGGMMGPIVAEAAVIAAAYPGGKRFPFVIISIIIFPIPAASAIADPDIPEKINDATTLTWPNPPLNLPTHEIQNDRSRSDIVPAFIIFAATINNGTASIMKLSYKPHKAVSAAKAMSCPATTKYTIDARIVE
jgi:hypothetical protein